MLYRMGIHIQLLISYDYLYTYETHYFILFSDSTSYSYKFCL